MRSATFIDAPSVGDLARRVNVALRALGDGWVEGEVQSITVHRSGHIYLSLADEAASIDACIFRGRRRGCEPLPAEGDLVKAHYERVDFYAPRGDTKLIVDRLEPTGEGELLRRRAQALSRLRADGLCDPARRRALLPFPRRIGVIAAYDAKRDVIEHLRRRLPAQNIAFCAAAVQGVEAVGSIIDALGRLQGVADVDVIILARGGGSVSDLVPFDDERLCRAIATSPVPVVTSIGHTKDRPNCDHVAAACATVPAKAAELVVPRSADDLLADLDRHASALAGVSGAMRERAVAIADLWKRVRPGGRLAVLAGELEASADLLSSRAAGTWRGRELAITRAGRELDAAVIRLRSQASIDPLRERLQVAAAAFFADHWSRLNGHRDALDAAGRRIPRAERLDVLAARLENGAGLAGSRRRDYGRALDRLAATGVAALGRRVRSERARVDAEAGRLRPAGDRVLSRARERVDALCALVEAKDLRRRGWILACDERGRAVRTTADLETGDELHLRFADGEATATVGHLWPQITGGRQ